MTNWFDPNRIFTRRELWYHLLMMPVLFPAGNYLFLGERYFTDRRLFVWGTGLVFLLYWLSLIILTGAVKGVFRRFPNFRQARWRNVTAILVATTLTVGLAAFDVWVYSLFPVFRKPFAWNTVRSTVLLGLVFDILLCLVLGMQYTYARWQENQTEKEQLKRLVVQHQFDTLKQQLNPHFLFNALNSVSSLIAEDQVQAEEFVNELAKVYRYLLQGNQRALVPLADEIQFVRSYARLLITRYGEALRIHINYIDPTREWAELPPLTLQLVIDNIIQQQSLKPDKPLVIKIEALAEGWLRVDHNHQPRTVLVDTGLPSFTDISSRYQAIGKETPILDKGLHTMRIWLPLLNGPPSSFLS